MRPAMFALVLLVAAPASAELVKPDLRCGPRIEREKVKVIDISELSPEDGVAFARDQIGGEWREVKREKVVAGTVFAGAWRDAEKKAAKLGCPFVILVDSWQEQTGTRPAEFGNEMSPRVPVYKNAVEAVYVMPRGSAPSQRRSDNEKDP